MARQTEVGIIYAAGITQGVALVTFPATSTIFTSPQYYNLSNTAFGTMFLPQAVAAIAASFLGAELTNRLGLKRIFLTGLAANLLSMLLLFISQFVAGQWPVDYALLLLATLCLGAGFGLTVPALNTYVADFYPDQIDSKVLILNALLGLGTALAPVFSTIFVGLNIWWGLPLMAAMGLAVLIFFSLSQPLTISVEESKPAGGAAERLVIPGVFWIFAALTLLYGICETMFGNWAIIYLSQNEGVSTQAAQLALTTFWGAVTVGRLLVAALSRVVSVRLIYVVLPFIIAVAFLMIARLPSGSPWAGVLAYGLGGLGCSAFFPLSISFGQQRMTTIAASVAGGLIAFYQIGYGLAAFGVGPLEEAAGLSLGNIYGLAIVVAVAMFAVALVTMRYRPQPVESLA